MKKARVYKSKVYWIAQVPSSSLSWDLEQQFRTWRQAYNWTCAYLTAIDKDYDTPAPIGM